MSTTDNKRYQTTQSAAYATLPHARLLHYQRSDKQLLVRLTEPNGARALILVTTADHPELSALPEYEQSRVRYAFLALHPDQGAPPDVASNHGGSIAHSKFADHANVRAAERHELGGADDLPS